MERRVRLNWSEKHKRPWCPGLSLPRQDTAVAPPALTGFMRVQGLVERIRQRRAAAADVLTPRLRQELEQPRSPLPSNPVPSNPVVSKPVGSELEASRDPGRDAVS